MSFVVLSETRMTWKRGPLYAAKRARVRAWAATNGVPAACATSPGRLPGGEVPPELPAPELLLADPLELLLADPLELLLPAPELLLADPLELLVPAPELLLADPLELLLADPPELLLPTPELLLADPLELLLLPAPELLLGDPLELLLADPLELPLDDPLELPLALPLEAPLDVPPDELPLPAAPDPPLPVPPEELAFAGVPPPLESLPQPVVAIAEATTNTPTNPTSSLRIRISLSGLARRRERLLRDLRRHSDNLTISRNKSARRIMDNDASCKGTPYELLRFLSGRADPFEEVGINEILGTPHRALIGNEIH